jgi:hypothetical protein
VRYHLVHVTVPCGTRGTYSVGKALCKVGYMAFFWTYIKERRAHSQNVVNLAWMDEPSKRVSHHDHV